MRGRERGGCQGGGPFPTRELREDDVLVTQLSSHKDEGQGKRDSAADRHLCALLARNAVWGRNWATHLQIKDLRDGGVSGGAQHSRGTAGNGDVSYWLISSGSSPDSWRLERIRYDEDQ